MVAYKRLNGSTRYQKTRNAFIDAMENGDIENFVALSKKLSKRDLMHGIDYLMHGYPTDLDKAIRSQMSDILIGRFSADIYLNGWDVFAFSPETKQAKRLTAYMEEAIDLGLNSVISNLLMPTCRFLTMEAKGKKYTQASSEEKLALVVKKLGHERDGELHERCKTSQQQAREILSVEALYQDLDNIGDTLEVDMDFALWVVAAEKGVTHAHTLNEKKPNALANEAIGIMTDKIIGLNVTGKEVPAQTVIREKYQAAYQRLTQQPAKQSRVWVQSDEVYGVSQVKPQANVDYFDVSTGTSHKEAQRLASYMTTEQLWGGKKEFTKIPPPSAIEAKGTQGRRGDLGPDYLQVQ